MLKRSLRAVLVIVAAALAGTAGAAEGTVIITNEKCDYLLMDSSQGQVLLKLIKGNMPKRGDRLTGEFKQRDFSDMTNLSDNSKVNVWVDLVDRNTSKALMRYGQYCP